MSHYSSLLPERPQPLVEAKSSAWVKTQANPQPLTLTRLLMWIFVLVRLKMLCGLFNVLSRKVRESCVVAAASSINLLLTASSCHGSLESPQQVRRQPCLKSVVPPFYIKLEWQQKMSLEQLQDPQDWPSPFPLTFCEPFDSSFLHPPEKFNVTAVTNMFSVRLPAAANAGEVKCIVRYLSQVWCILDKMGGARSLLGYLVVWERLEL